MTNFVSVATSAARYQDISLNPQKLAGQCAKLKCCLNYEVDAYVECVKKMPSKEVTLETANNTYYFFKCDIFKKELTYSTDKQIPANLVTISAARAFEIIALNKKGVKPEELANEESESTMPVKEFGDIVGQDSVTRFDKAKKNKKKKSGNKRNGQPKGQNPQTKEQNADRQPQQDEQTPQRNNKNKGKQRNGFKKQNRPQGQNKESNKQNEG